MKKFIQPTFHIECIPWQGFGEGIHWARIQKY
jgi:hypothetical protein